MTGSAEQFADTVAIVGMSARLPRAADVDAFWSNLLERRESIRTFTREELIEAGTPAHVVDDEAYVPAAGIPDDIASIDLGLFGLTHGEAEMIDPQQRLFLECAWEALEDSGSMLPEGERRTGVFAACDFNTYLPFVIAPRLGDVGSAKEFQVEIGNDKDFLATRVAYKLNLRGPAVVVQTACSSSLVAVHFACESLRSGACDAALAGGSRLHVPLVAGHLHHEGGVSAAEPHCRAFDAEATGTLRGNGTAVVALKRTEDAITDGDHIYALVMGSAINNDGSDKVGFTAPSVRGQKAVIREALAVAGIAPEEVGYVETHGTGTALGDPIEVEALADALHARRTDRRPCVLGAVKPSIGHLGSAAGITGLIKAALALDREAIPGTLNFTTPNPELRLHETRFVITRETTPWARTPSAKRVAGVSSFGIGGTNCHVVLAEAPVAPASEVDDAPRVLALSAATPSALQATAGKLARWLQEEPGARLTDVARTLQVGRRALRYRSAPVADSIAAAVERLGEIAATPPPRAADPAGVCMLVPGQGSEFAGMGVDTMGRHPTFRADIEACAAILRNESGLDLLAFLRSGDVPRGRTRTELVQPALFAVECALARLLSAWGIVPTSVVGHSIGEYSAAAVAGVFSFEDGVRVAAARGRAMGALARGAMTAVRAGEDDVRAHLHDGVVIAAANAPRLTVVAGSESSISAFEARLRSASTQYTRIRVDRAFHTPDVHAVASELEAAVGRIALSPPRIPLYSNVSGQPLTDDQATSQAYWVSHAASPVRFLDCIRSAETARSSWYLEVGPGTALGRFTHQSLPPRSDACVLATLGRAPGSERETLLRAVAALWEGGTTIAWERLGESEDARKVRIPTYPFERQRCWFGDARPIEKRPNVVAAAANGHEKPPVSASAPGDIVATVTEIVAEVMGIDPADVSRHTSFVEQGLESLALLEVGEVLRRRLGAHVSLPDLLEELATVDALAHHLSTAHMVAPQPRESDPAAAPAHVRPFGAPPLDGALTNAERAYLANLVPAYVARTAKSKDYNERYRRAHADPRNSAGFRSAWKEIVYPLVVDRAEGASIWDLDGNRYVDLTMAFGVGLFGHSPPFVREALTSQLETGIAVGPQTGGSGVVAEQLCRITGFDRAVLTNSGTEAVMAAIRLARALTRRDRIVIFRGSYHGTYDGVLARATCAPAALGIPRSLVSDVVVLPYGTDDALELLTAEGDTIAAVVVEPVQSRNPSFQPHDYLREIRAATRKAGTLLVLDEMLTGFRCHPGGINALWNVDADVATYGKVLGGGMPIGAVAGRASVLDLVDGGHWRYGDDSRPEADLTFFAGTFCKHPLAMASAAAVLTEIERRGPALQDELSARTAGLIERIEESFRELNCPIEVQRFGSQFSFDPGPAGTVAELFFKAMLLRGVYVWEGRTSFLSTAHSPEDVEDVFVAAVESARELIDAGVVARERATTRPSTQSALETPFPCRDEQRLLWLGMEMHPEAAAAYNEVLTIPLAGDVDERLIEKTTRSLVRRHDALRLRLDATGESQRAVADDDFDLEVVEVGDDEHRWQRARAIVGSLRDGPFDLEQGPMVRAALLRLSLDESVYVLVAAHLAVDGWSLSVLRAEFAETYRALASGGRPKTEDAATFADFVAWESAGIAGGGTSSLEYWTERLEGLDPNPVLAGSPSARRVYDARSLRHEFAPGTSRRLAKLCAGAGTTPFSAGLAAWCAALASKTGKDDVTVAITLAGQPHAGSLDLVGYCLKVLPIRVAVEPGSFVRLIATVHATVAEARRHWFVDESALIQRFWSRRVSSRPPMGGVTFQYERPEPDVVLPGATEIDIDLVGRPLTKWDATIVLVQEADCLSAELVYTSSALDDDDASALLERYAVILDDACRGVEDGAGEWVAAGRRRE